MGLNMIFRMSLLTIPSMLCYITIIIIVYAIQWHISFYMSTHTTGLVVLLIFFAKYRWTFNISFPSVSAIFIRQKNLELLVLLLYIGPYNTNHDTITNVQNVQIFCEL